MPDRVSSALACVYLARAASTLACCAAADSLRSSGSSRIRGWPFWTRCPTSTDRSRIFPPTRKPKSPCTRASTIPVKVLRVEPAASVLNTSTLGDCRRGSVTAGLEHPPAIKVTVSHPVSRAMVIRWRRTFFTESFNRGALSRLPSRREFLNLFSAFGSNCQFHKPAAPTAADPHQTVSLQWPEISHKRRALHPQPITQFRHVPTVLGFQ